jgi:peptidoglycan/LPS O-acetylase OafA/YrhL
MKTTQVPPPQARIPGSSRERILGLDVMRAVAIALVVFAHSSYLLSPPGGAFRWFPRIDGVDLFFVLSGFLVGGLLLRDPLRGATGWYRHLLDFWQRRWLRTLPNYFVFLVLNILLVHWGLAPGLLGPATAAYVVFMQNFHVPLDLFFWESWSLAVEEWFYALFPILLTALVLIVRLPFPRAYLLTALVFCAVPVVTRIEALQHVASAADVDLFVRKLVITRLDAIGIGALAAWAMTAFPRLWHGSRWPLFIVGLVLLSVASDHRPDPSARAMTALHFTLIPLTIACLLPLLSNWRSTHWAGRPVVLVSRSAYALYLVHMPLLYLFQRAAPHLHLPGVVLACCYWSACLLVSLVVLHTIELPFMRLRDRVGLRIRKEHQRPVTPR